MKRLALLAAALAAAGALAQNPSSPGVTNGLRGNGALDAEPTTARMPKPVNNDRRPGRNYPTQPPIIPHHIDGYQIDTQFNKCLSCHALERTEESNATPVGTSHYLDRGGKVHKAISPRRYFCTQCHVPQLDIELPVTNTFDDPAVTTKPKMEARK
jgi:cytochrome c-type protein NapB